MAKKKPNAPVYHVGMSQVIRLLHPLLKSLQK